MRPWRAVARELADSGCGVWRKRSWFGHRRRDGDRGDRGYNARAVRLDLRSNLRREAKQVALAALPRRLRMALRSARQRGRVRHVRDMAELDRELRAAYEAFQISEDAGREALQSFDLIAGPDLPADPRSEAYRQAQLALYERVAGKAYTPAAERSIFDAAAAVRSPFPYNTGSAEVVGDQLIALGFLMKAMGLASPSSVLEFGPGWGNTTDALVRMGHRVTAVEIDPAFVALIGARCKDVADRLTLVTADMLEFRTSERFDLVLFFESFHHCADHRAMLARLADLVHPGGKVVFAGEPVLDLAYPWGLRLDGQSLWSVRQLGWLELGFDTAYFFSALRDFGWDAERHQSRAISPLADVIVATRSRT